MWPFSQPRWKTVAAQKQGNRSELIQDCLSTLPAVKDEHADEKYTSVSASQIVKNISEGKWLAVDVVSAYIRRAAYVQRHSNPITEVLFMDALEQARALDEEFKRTGRIKGPLHGVPISIKDQMNIAGYDTSIGFSAWCNKPATKDANVVKAVKEAGGIIICKTNVPQTMLNFECSNPTWGITRNPWNGKYTCGGSSGGEGAIIAADGSAIGIGSDVGGSLRIPALYCGIYSLKPSVDRISTEGAISPNPGFDAIKATPGPMGRSVGDVEVLSRVLFSSAPSNTWEGVPHVPYKDVQLPSKLRIGYYFEDHFIKTSPANIRAVQEAVDALKRQGHELVEFDLPDGPRAIQLFAAITSGEGYHTLLSHCDGDPVEKNLFLITLGPKLPRWLHSCAVWFIRTVLKDPLFASGLKNSKHSNLTEYWSNVAKKKEMNKQFYEQVWDKYSFDAIIAPGMACPPLPHGATRELSPLANGTFFYNVVESPVGVIPVTRVDPAKDALSAEWEKLRASNGSSSILDRRIFGTGGTGGVYNPEGMKGLPLGIQIVGRRWEDEKVIATMRAIDQALGPRGFGPGSWDVQTRMDVTS